MKDRLSQEDLEKLKHWAEKGLACKSPHCGERCIIEPRKGENDETKHLCNQQRGVL